MRAESRSPQPNFAFGAFTVYLPERRVERDGVALKMGARAFDILTVLLDHAGDTVSKQEISERVWPGINVGETSLRFQIVGLRKMLSDGQDDRVIATIPGRGYCFVIPVTRTDRPALPIHPLPDDQRARLPARLSHMVGREEEIADLCTLVEQHRFATVLGTGGIGKTTLAVAAAHALAERFSQDTCFVDLGSIRDASKIGATLSASLGLPVGDADPVTALATFLRDRRILIILDSCEHVVAAAADLAERLFRAAPKLHIVATSREALRVEGEHVFVLSPFACPADDGSITVEQLMTYASVRLLLDRAAAAGTRTVLGPDDIAVVADICRRLDGIALAIELAAGRVPTYGLHGIAALLDNRFRYLQGGRRTAIARHRTLSDTLAWSYDLLNEHSRVILHRLTIFVGSFGFEAASVVCDEVIDETEAVEIIESLVAKSLIGTRSSGDTVRYRLLDTTRAYLVDRFADLADAAAVRRRHAELFRDLASDPIDHNTADANAERIPNTRAALAWTFGPDGDLALGVALAAAAAPLFLRCSLLTECRDISLRALEALDEESQGSLLEMELQTCLGQSLMFTAGNTIDVERAFERALELAERVGTPARQLRLLGALHIFHERTGDFGKALDFAERGFAVAKDMGNEDSLAAAHSLLGIAWHLLGRHEKADRHLGPAMAPIEDVRGIDPTSFGFNHRNRACIAFARSRWLQGASEEAAAIARATVEESIALGHPVTHCIALIWAISVAEWREDWTEMQAYVERFSAHADRHSLRPYLAVGNCMRGQLAIRSGNVADGIAMIVENLETLHVAQYEMLTTSFMTTMAEGLTEIGQLDQALDVITRCEAMVERNGDRLHMPEVMRVRAGVLAAKGEIDAGRLLLEQALSCAREQSAVAWELKCACDLVATDRRGAALTLPPILSRYEPAEGDAIWRRARHLVTIDA